MCNNFSMDRLFEDIERRYVGTHPWITFRIDLTELHPSDWLLLGEAESKVAHVAGVPLIPGIAERLHRVYLSKGAHGTTAIEGNTLSEEDVLELVEGNLDLPPSREYLEQEVQNIVDAYNRIIGEVISEGPQPLTVERIRGYNRQVLDGLDLAPGIVPGEIRTDEVGVRRYLGAPAEDCEYLLGEFCDWMNSADFEVQSSDRFAFTRAFAKAVAAHLYLAWIHPFGDGNGRTARLIEFQALVEAGVPIPAAHLLSDHYNKTRTRYYEVLDRASRVAPYSPREMMSYALEGFVDELREQLRVVRDQQHSVTWINYVHELFQDRDTVTARRQRHLALDLPPDVFTPRSALREVSPRVAAGYGGKGRKTVTRDINKLVELGLVERGPKGGIRPSREVVLAFLPVSADGPLAEQI